MKGWFEKLAWEKRAFYGEPAPAVHIQINDWYLMEIVPMHQWNTIYILFSNGQGVQLCNGLKNVYNSIFVSNFDRPGGNQIYRISQIQISLHYPGGRDVVKIMDFFHDFAHILFGRLP